jgi:hypothetical protein
LPGLGVISVDALGAHVFHVVVGFALASALNVAGLWLGPDAQPAASTASHRQRSARISSLPPSWCCSADTIRSRSRPSRRWR